MNRFLIIENGNGRGGGGDDAGWGRLRRPLPGEEDEDAHKGPHHPRPYEPDED